MKLYMNCEKFHCSMEQKNRVIFGYIAEHLTITRKPKYPKIHPKVNICEICIFDQNLCKKSGVKIMRVDD